MTGVCVDGRVHLAQNSSDLDGNAMRVHNEVIKIVIFWVAVAVAGQVREPSFVWKMV